MTTLAQDTFAGRTNSGTWNTASDGNAWTKLHGNGVNTILSVGSNEGKAHAGNTRCENLLGSGTATDQDGTARLALGQSGDSVGIILRSDNTGDNYYFSEYGAFPGDITIYKVVGGSSTLLNIWATGASPAAGTFFHIRFRASGTTLETKFWLDGNSEPAGWTGSLTDSTYASGQYGIFLNSFGATDLQVDNYICTDNGIAGGGATHLRIMDGYGGVFS